MTVTNFALPAARYRDQETFNRQMSYHFGLLMQGKANNILDVTVTNSAAATTVTDARIGVNTVAICIPTSANAAAVAAPYRNITAPVNGSMSLVHANNGNTKTYKVILIG